MATTMDKDGEGGNPSLETLYFPLAMKIFLGWHFACVWKGGLNYKITTKNLSLYERSMKIHSPSYAEKTTIFHMWLWGTKREAYNKQ